MRINSWIPLVLPLAAAHSNISSPAPYVLPWYICNWFGGQAISLATKYKHSKQFQAAGYAPFLIDGVEYGETREYGNFSFTRVYESGHEVPFYQPIAALQLFNRTLNGWELPTGEKKLTPGFGSSDPASATHTQASVPLPTPTKSSSFSVGRQMW
ncbi:hypothetical protein PENDEC_c001G05455 [Penicillium decumbens]|uniref:Uncharacterized protein n=1 Tax=Penicillium decumbens TaxID=69771 RepID=A0A1V6PQ24_PENDC|nr:hypothetical protein PENDEC_c001G05455 [Penicillium decumbens]